MGSIFIAGAGGASAAGAAAAAAAGAAAGAAAAGGAAGASLARPAVTVAGVGAVPWPITKTIVNPTTSTVRQPSAPQNQPGSSLRRTPCNVDTRAVPLE